MRRSWLWTALLVSACTKGTPPAPAPAPEPAPQEEVLPGHSRGWRKTPPGFVPDDSDVQRSALRRLQAERDAGPSAEAVRLFVGDRVEALTVDRVQALDPAGFTPGEVNALGPVLEQLAPGKEWNTVSLHDSSGPVATATRQELSAPGSLYGIKLNRQGQLRIVAPENKEKSGEGGGLRRRPISEVRLLP